MKASYVKEAKPETQGRGRAAQGHTQCQIQVSSPTLQDVGRQETRAGGSRHLLSWAVGSESRGLVNDQPSDLNQVIPGAKRHFHSLSRPLSVFCPSGRRRAGVDGGDFWSGARPGWRLLEARGSLRGTEQQQ